MAERKHHALILFAHGARDARWGHTLQVLRQAVLVRQPQSHVQLAFLEFQSPTLADALSGAIEAGCTQIDIAPIFWASGGHIVNDLPPVIDEFRRAHPHIQVTLLPVLSELPGMPEFIASALHTLASKPA